MNASTSRPQVLRSRSELRAAMDRLRAAGETSGLVPTMGALHAGHLSLVEAARKDCDATFVTIFVNPTQFGPQEDLARYPRTLDEDLARLGELEADYAFAPAAEEMYPQGYSTYVDPPAVSAGLEGACRPGHFRGVATVVLKLFQLIPADIAYFGEKDYQQYLVIRRMVEDFNLPITIRGCPIVREADGLAISSRNRYLSASERAQASALSRGLAAARQLVRDGQRDAAVVLDRIRGTLDAAGITKIDYVAVTDAETLQPLARIDRPARALIAAYVGATRLIDNCGL